MMTLLTYSLIKTLGIGFLGVCILLGSGWFLLNTYIGNIVFIMLLVVIASFCLGLVYCDVMNLNI